MKKCCDIYNTKCLTSCINCDNAILDKYIDNGYEIVGEPIFCSVSDDEYHKAVIEELGSCEDFECRYSKKGMI